MSDGVHIVTTGFVPRDAISQHVIEEQRVIREMGLRCEIFAEPGMTHPAYRDAAHSIRAWKRLTRPNDAAILHYSIANPTFEWVIEQARACGLTYHNITPPEHLWRFAPRLALECMRGRLTLERFVGRTAATAGDSEFNAQELSELGFLHPHVVGIMRPPLPEPTGPSHQSDAFIRVLFVGRGVPNKAQHELILAIATLRDLGVAAELRLVGSWDGLNGYLQYCERLVASLRLGHQVIFTGSVDDNVLAEAYASSHVFLCLSDHEGFCAPLVEAMQAELPIVAYRAGAIPGTVGRAALLLDEKPPSLVAEAIIEVVRNDALRARMAEARRERLQHHGAEAVTLRLRTYLERLT